VHSRVLNPSGGTTPFGLLALDERPGFYPEESKMFCNCQRDAISNSISTMPAPAFVHEPFRMDPGSKRGEGTRND
jgi:hypothetical protein